MCDGRGVDGLNQSDIDVEAPTAVLYLEILLGRGSKVQVSRNKGGEPSYMRIM